MHSMQRKAKLGAVVGDALVCVQYMLELGCVRFVACVCFTQTVKCQAAELLEAASVFLFQRSATLQEAGEVLRVLVSEGVVDAGKMHELGRSQCWL